MPDSTHKFICPYGHKSDYTKEVYRQSNAEKAIITCLHCGAAFCKEREFDLQRIYFHDKVVDGHVAIHIKYYQLNGAWTGDKLEFEDKAY